MTTGTVPTGHVAPATESGPTGFERATRLLLILSAAAAVTLQTHLGAHGTPRLVTINVTLGVTTFVLARGWPRVAHWVVLLPAYVFPVLVWLLLGGWDEGLWAIWTTMLLAYVAGRAPFATWALPRPWRWPLGLWGLSVAVSWPLIVWREIDFTVSQLSRYNTGVTNVGIPPAVECAWIAHVAATHLIGILWIDSLFRDRADSRAGAGFPAVALPLLAGLALSVGAAFFQIFVRIDALNPTLFAVLHRAAGGMLDANAFGMAAALWVAGTIAVAAAASTTSGRLVAVTMTLAILGAVWGSGSETATLVCAVTLAGTAYGLWHTRGRWQRRHVLAVVAALVLMAGASLSVGRIRTAAIGPVARFEANLRRWNKGNDGQSRSLKTLKAMWSRDQYGTASTAMVREYPWTGVGVGMFNTLVLDETLLLGMARTWPDNAQNWFRHQLAETGVLGSLGWMVWLALFVPVFWRRPAGESALAVNALRGGLIGLGLTSLVAMPTQNISVLVTFWVLVFWLWTATTPAVDDARGRPAPGWLWAAGFVIVAGYGLAVWHVGKTALRVPERAARLGWTYDHGLYGLEKAPDNVAYRWTEGRAVVVVPVTGTGSYFPVTVWVHHPDVAEHPVHVRVSVDGHVVLDQTLTNALPVTRYVALDPKAKGVLVETSVDRTWRPSSQGGGHDDRDLGLAIADWQFVCCPPAGAVVVD